MEKEEARAALTFQSKTKTRKACKMKKVLGLLAMAAILVIPNVARAGDQLGIYVTPKFIYGYTQMDGFKGSNHEVATGISESETFGSQHDDAFGGALAIGYDFDKQFDVPIRAEIEYSILSKVEAKRSSMEYDHGQPDWYSKNKQTFGIQTLFLNAYWDIDTGTAFTPYVGGGLGMAIIDTKFKAKNTDYTIPEDYSFSSGSKTVTNFAWNVGAGLGYDITESWTVDLGYRFVSLGSVKSKNLEADYNGDVYEAKVKTEHLYQHQVALGLRYTF